MGRCFEKYQIFLFGSLVVFLLSCTNDTTDPNIINEIVEYPDKLYPYETYYDAATFKARRDNLVNLLPSDAIAIITTNETYLRNGDVDFEFKPASNFFYLTGFDEQNAVAIIKRNASDINTSELIMFVEHREGVAVQWLGSVYGPENAMDIFGADTAYRYEDFGPYLRMDFNPELYESIFANFETNETIADTFYFSLDNIPEVYNVDGIVDSIRAIKSAIEIDMIQKAVDVSIQAFTEAIAAIEPGMYEYEAEAIFDYITARNGCTRTEFPTIVASGPNLNTLHYSMNNRQMLDGDLVMIDFGAEYGYYAADITRTLPVNGTFTPEQTTVYGIVLETHKAVIETAAPGVSYYTLYSLHLDMILNGLLENGIITGNKDDIISSYQYRQYIPAGLGHCVGLDVHDPFPSEPDGNKILRENMVMAFEPHIYLYKDDQTVDPNYWNVSARIEDVVLITSTGSQILSNNLPMEISEIEALMD